MKPLSLGLRAFIFAAAIGGGVQAQNHPSKPIRLIVPYPSGGSNDVLSRITAQTMKLIVDEVSRWRKVARDTGIRPD